MSNLFGKIKEFVGLPGSDELDGEYDDLIDVSDQDYDTDYVSTMDQPVMDTKESFHASSDTEFVSKNGPSANNVVGMPGTNRYWGSAAEVLVMEPRGFEEMPQVIQALRERKSIVLNLSLMDPAQAQRSVDFVAGATYTIDGHQERVGENIFLFTPNCVQVRTQSGVIHESPQVAVTPSRITTTSWKTDPVMGSIAQ